MKSGRSARADALFEVSWEVCNKVGGINTVLKSKASLMREQYENYTLIGPYFEEKARVIFQEQEAPEAIRRAMDAVAGEGIRCHYGIWQIKGRPNVILIDFSGFADQKDRLKGELWESHKIDSLGAPWEFEEPVLFGAAVARLLQAVERELSGQKLVAHFHEWMAGTGILFLQNAGSSFRTVFTTHATMLGRAIAGSGEDLYEMLDSMDPVAEAYRHGVQAKHLTERACAQHCTIFTTVSEITGLEAEKLLGRKPDVLLLNGLDNSKFPTFEETSIKHLTCREKLRSFLTYYFFPHYLFPLDHNLIFFITGRFEFKNKGIDLTIKALGRLNELMQQEQNEKQRTVTVFFWIPMAHSGVKVELLENKNYYHHLVNYLQFNADNILKKVLYDFLSQKDMKNETLFTQEFLQGMKKDLLQFKRQGKPPLCTNYLPSEQNELLDALRAAGLDNREENPVKVVVQPVYLDGNDGLINLPYYDAIAGTHLGLFPSYYEPWGYTPLETAALGVAAVTTDLAGFGRFIEPHLPAENPGIEVLHRHKRSEAEVVEEFSQRLFEFTQISHTSRVQRKISAKELSMLCDWSEFIKYYIEAHNRALE